MLLKNIHKYVLLSCLAVLVIACQPQPTPTATPSPEPSITPTEATATPTAPPLPTQDMSGVNGANTLDPSKRANIRVLVAVPDAPPVDVVVDDAPFSTRLTAGRLTSPQPLTPSEHIVKVVPNGGTGDPLLEEPQAFAEGQSSILAFTGTAGGFVTTRIDEDLSPLRPGQARVQVVYLAPDNAAVVPIDVRLGDVLSGSLANTGDQIGPAAVAAATYQFTATRGNQTITQSIPLSAHRNYTFLLVWQSEDKLQLIRNVTPTLRQSLLRVVHGGNGLPGYDVFVDGQPTAMGITFRNATEWQPLAPKSYEVKVYPIGGDPNTTPLLQRQITLSPDQALDVIIYDSTDDSAGRGAEAVADIVTFKEDLLPTAPGKANLTFVHLARTKDDISVQQGGVTYQNVAPVKFRRLSETISVDPGEVRLAFLTINGATETTAEAPAAFTMEAGFSYLYLITGNQADDTPSIISADVGSDSGVDATPVVAATALPPSTMRLRLLNALEDEQALDLYLGDTQIATNVSPGTASVYVPVTTELRNLRLVKTGTMDVVAQNELVYQANRMVTYLAYGTTSAAVFRDMLDAVAPTTTDAVVRFINANPAATIVTVFQTPNAVTFVTPTTEELFQGIRFGSATEAKAIPDGLYDLAIRSTEDRTEIANLKSVEWKPNIRYDVVLLPPAGGASTARVVIVSSEQ